MVGRSAALARFAHGGRFDLAVAHGSTDQPLAARLAGTPQVTMFDYEFAAAMHRWNGRLASRVLVPAAIPEAALRRFGMSPPRLVRYPGIKEEYYLADHASDPAAARDELGLDGERIVAVVRPPPEVTLYHRGAPTDLFARTLARLLEAAPAVQTVVLPRTGDQRRALAGGPAIVPERPVDGPSLVAAADLVVSAGGTMNREAAALGVPAYTPFAARLGAVDRRLIEEGRLRRLESPDDLALRRRDRGPAPPLRDPDLLLDLILAPGRGRVPGS
jgi:predicted glycosyltransferase